MTNYKPTRHEVTIIVLAAIISMVVMSWLDTKLDPQKIYMASSTTQNIQIVATSTKQHTTKKSPKPAKKEVLTVKDTRQVPGDIIGHDINTSNVLNAINQQRYNAGLEILKENTALSQAAAAKLKDMQDKKYFAHQSPEGKWPWDFIKDTGYKYKYAGENLAGPKVQTDDTVTYFVNITDLMDAWMASPLHKENILKDQYTDTGIAVSDDGHLIVQLFAKPI